MSMYEIDSAYVRRCQKRLREWGAPLSGWYCDYIYDVADEEEDPDHIDLLTCELCDCAQVRFVHVMRHDEYFEAVPVGCICAGIMEGDIFAARERERLMKHGGQRERTVPPRHWRKTGCGTYPETHVSRK